MNGHRQVKKELDADWQRGGSPVWMFSTPTLVRGFEVEGASAEAQLKRIQIGNIDQLVVLDPSPPLGALHRVELIFEPRVIEVGIMLSLRIWGSYGRIRPFGYCL